VTLTLTDADKAEITDALAGLEVEGDRYTAANMALVGADTPEKEQG
jgi:hypothetical protein